MTLTVALRNLIHDKTRLVATLVGIVFSVVLVGGQLGFYVGASRMITSIIDHADADLWVMPVQTESIEDGLPLLTHDDRSQAIGITGVASATPLLSGFADWRRPDGATTHVLLLGLDPSSAAIRPWNVVEGRWGDGVLPRSVAVDRSYEDELGVHKLGDPAVVEEMSARVVAFTAGIRSFAQTPIVFTTLSQARTYYAVGGDKLTFLLVSLKPGADAGRVKAELARVIRNVDVLTPAEFRARALDRWLVQTGAGIALIGGALLSALIGTIIVAQTLYSSTNEYIKEFAMLRAIGSTSGYIFRVILAQAGITAVVGYIIGMACTLGLVGLSQGTALALVVTPGLAALLFALTLVIAAIAAIAAIFKVTRIDPAVVFAR